MDRSKPLFLAFAALAAFILAGPVQPASASKDPAVWVMPYYLAVNQQRQPPSTIDFSCFTHLIHFGIVANSDGTIDPVKCGITAAQSQAVIGPAHKAGDKVLVCVQTDDGAKNLRSSISDASRGVFVRSLVSFVTSRGYDGLDIDMEPIRDVDIPQFEKLVWGLREAMNATGHHLILTAAVAGQPKMFARLQGAMDRVDLMTYDLSGPEPGNRSWYNAAVFDGGRGVMSSGSPQSADAMITEFEKAGVRPEKLSLGIAFYGYVWSGDSAPGQPVKGVTVDDGAEYQMIMNDYYQPHLYHWDQTALAPWIGIDSSDKSKRRFISYDDPRLCMDKMIYVRQHHLGGAIIWEMTGGYVANRPPGKRDLLLKSVKYGWQAPLDKLTAWKSAPSPAAKK